MGKTHNQKEKQRTERLKSLPRSERLAKSAVIKRKEGRVLDASEKHALKMTTEFGEILKLWEVLRTLPSPDKDIAEKQQASIAKKAEKRQAKKEGKKLANQKRTAFAAEDDEDDDEDGDTAANGTAAPTTGAAKDGQAATRQQREKQRNEHKHEAVDQLMKLIVPKFASYARTPRISRVVQSMIKLGSNAHLEKLLGLFAKDFATFCNDAFASFAVCALIRHAPHALYRKVLQLVVPVMPQIVTHTFGMRVVNAAYSSRLANALDRNLVALGVFKDGVAVMKHWPGYPVLEDILAQATDYKKRLLGRLFDVSDKLVSQKDSFDYPFVQRLVHAYMLCGVKHEITELCVSLKKYVVAACETKEGAALASVTFAILPPGDRKELLRGFSEKLAELAVGKYSAPILARLFDLVYDPQLLCKYIVNNLLEPTLLRDVLSSPYGYQIFVHLLTPELARKEKHLLPYFLADHNLYAQENKQWNLVTWLDAEMQPETVEVCPKDAQRTHLSVLGPIVRKLLDVLPTVANKHNCMVIAKELLHLSSTMPLYKKALSLTAADVAALTLMAPEKPLRDEAGMKIAAAPGAAAPSADAPNRKKQRTEAPVAAAIAGKKPVAAAPAAKAAAPVAKAGTTPTRGSSAPALAAAKVASPAAPAADTASAKKKLRTEDSGSPARRSAVLITSSPVPAATAAAVDDDDVPMETSARGRDPNPVAAGKPVKRSASGGPRTPARPSVPLVMTKPSPLSTGMKRARAPEDL